MCQLYNCNRVGLTIALAKQHCTRANGSTNAVASENFISFNTAAVSHCLVSATVQAYVIEQRDMLSSNSNSTQQTRTTMCMC
jgi:hypothetical protein